MRSLECGRSGRACVRRSAALFAVCVSGLVLGWPRASAAQERDAALRAGSAAPPDEKRAREAKPETPRELAFAGAVHRSLLDGCRSCHSASGVAGRSKYVLDGTLDEDYAATRGQVSAARPESSALLRRASGMAHPGGAIFPASGADYQRLLRWIRDGAKRGGVAATSAVIAVTAPPTAAPPSFVTAAFGEPRAARDQPAAHQARWRRERAWEAGLRKTALAEPEHREGVAAVVRPCRFGAGDAAVL